MADAIIEHIDPIRLKIEDYMKNPEYLIDVLTDGGDRARSIAEHTIDEVKRKVGLGVCLLDVERKAVGKIAEHKL